MITLWQKIGGDWVLLSQHETMAEAEAQLFALRSGEGEFRAEKREGSLSSILDI